MIKSNKGDESMLCTIRSMGISGIRGSGVAVECYISNGLPNFDIVGLPDAAVKEAERSVRQQNPAAPGFLPARS